MSYVLMTTALHCNYIHLFKSETVYEGKQNFSNGCLHDESDTTYVFPSFIGLMLQEKWLDTNTE